MLRRSPYIPALAVAVCGLLIAGCSAAGLSTGFVWGLESSGRPAVTVLSLSRTTDNGRSWRHSGTRLVFPPGGQVTPLLSFSDASHGWLVLGNTTWRTVNGGLTCTRG